MMADFLRSAADRAANRADRFRAAGWWDAAPVDVVRDASARAPDRVALVGRDASFTYGQLDALVDRAVAVLRAEGVGAGDPVLVVAGNEARAVVALHAALGAGAVAMVVPDAAGADQIREIVARTRPALTVASPDAVPEGSGGAPTRWITPDHLVVDAAPGERGARRQPRAPDDPSLVIFTSGTTARPKGVVHSLNTLLLASRNYVETAHLTAADNLFVISPLASVTGVMQALAVAPLAGAQLTVERRFDAAATFDFLRQTGGTFFGGPDLLLGRIMDEAAARAVTDLPLRLVYLGGTMLDPRVLARAEEQHGITVLRAYGSSEAPLSTSSAVDDPVALRHHDDGRPVAGVEVAVGSADDPGECLVRGAHLFLGYVDPDDDAHAFDADGWFHTGDVAELRDGRLRISGRIKDVVVRNAMKVPIAEIDDRVGALAAVEECAGYGVADPATGERLVVAVRLRPGATLTLDDVARELLAAGVARWKLPEELVFWREPLPRTPSGKVRRSDLEAGGRALPRVAAARLQH